MKLTIDLTLEEMQNMVGKFITANPKVQRFENGVLEVWSQKYLVENFEIISDDVICFCTRVNCGFYFSVKDFILKIVR